MRGAGPRENGDALGGDMHWATGLSVRSPIWGLRQKIGDWLQLQAWANVGNLLGYDTGMWRVCLLLCVCARGPCVSCAGVCELVLFVCCARARP